VKLRENGFFAVQKQMGGESLEDSCGILQTEDMFFRPLDLRFVHLRIFLDYLKERWFPVHTAVDREYHTVSLRNFFI